MNQLTNNIYQKLATIQGKIKELDRAKENKFQKYFYFTEQQAIKQLKPLLEQERLVLAFSDSHEHFSYEKQEKDHVIRYLKIVTIGDEKETVTFNF